MVASKKIRKQFPIPKEAIKCVQEHREFFQDLVSMPHPLTRESWREKSQHNKDIVAEYDEKGKCKSLSGHNYVMDFGKIIMKVNVFGSGQAHRLTELGYDIFDEKFRKNPVIPPNDMKRMENMAIVQGCSPFAHALRCEEIKAKKNFKYVTTSRHSLVPIPLYSYHDNANYYPDLSDKNYVLSQEKIENFHVFKTMDDAKCAEIIQEMPMDALQEVYDMNAYAALWNMRNKLGVIDNDPTKLCILDLEQHVFHSKRFFYFQGEEGERQYTQDVSHSLMRVAQLLLKHSRPHFEKWKEMTYKDGNFNVLYEKHKDTMKPIAKLNYEDEERLRTISLYQ